MSNIQLRGICQVCGREHAVLKSGRMSKHGYTVDYGFFNGTCYGENYKPLQHDKSVALDTIERLSLEVERTYTRIENINNGKGLPETVNTYVKGSWEKQAVPLASLSAEDQKRELHLYVLQLENQARYMKDHADMLVRLISTYHGQPLKEVNKDLNKPERIEYNEKRLLENGLIARVSRIEGARIYFKFERDGRTFTAWRGSSAWRRLEKAN